MNNKKNKKFRFPHRNLNNSYSATLDKNDVKISLLRFPASYFKIYWFAFQNQKNFIERKKQLSPSPRITVSQSESCNSARCNSSLCRLIPTTWDRLFSLLLQLTVIVRGATTLIITCFISDKFYPVISNIYIHLYGYFKNTWVETEKTKKLLFQRAFLYIWCDSRFQ